MVRHHRPSFDQIVVGVLNVVDAQVVEDTDTDDIKQQDSSRFGDVRDLNRVETEDDGFASAEYTSKYTNIVGELLGGVGECADPVVHDVMP